MFPPCLFSSLVIVCYGLHCIPLKSTCWSPKALVPKTWIHVLALTDRPPRGTVCQNADLSCLYILSFLSLERSSVGRLLYCCLLILYVHKAMLKQRGEKRNSAPRGKEYIMCPPVFLCYVSSKRWLYKNAYVYGYTKPYLSIYGNKGIMDTYNRNPGVIWKSYFISDV